MAVDPQRAVVDRLLVYLAPTGAASLRPGARVRVPLKGRVVVGWVVGPADPPPGVPVKPIAAVEPETTWLLAAQVELALWVAARYLCSAGSVLAALAPPPPVRVRARGQAAGRPGASGAGSVVAVEGGAVPVRPPPTPEQARAVDEVAEALHSGQGRVFLLWGVTGSGKTRVYEEAVRLALARGRSAVVLVPEIALAPQMVRRLQALFGQRVAVFHSQMSAGQRRQAWERAAAGGPVVLVGARSAALAPVSRPALYVVDEEHESSYKQEEAPRYHAREVVLHRAQQDNAVVILGSATPSLEAYEAARRGAFQVLALASRVDGRPPPSADVVDLREELAAVGSPGPISRTLLEALRAVVSRGEQAILFVNRRGYAGAIICRECGFSWRCPHCDVSLTYHHGPSPVLRCHYCGYETAPLATCPRCGGRQLATLGFGTQKLEAALALHFPDVPVLRLDADTTGARHAHERILDAFASRAPAVLVGTQMVAKGHDFPGVTLAAAVLADVTLSLPDFRAAERTFQQLTQLAGRAGRGSRPGRVVVQTYRPDHHSVQAAVRGDVEGFYARELEFRRRSGYPPFASLVRLVAADPEEERARRAVSELARLLQEEAGSGPVRVLGPAPAPIRLLRDRYRWQVTVRGPAGQARELVRQLLAGEPLRGRMRPEAVTVDVDPMSVL